MSLHRAKTKINDITWTAAWVIEDPMQQFFSILIIDVEIVST